MTPERPKFVTEDHLIFLDRLRKSGITNMYGAPPYLREFDDGLSRNNAVSVVAYWMRTFSQRHPVRRSDEAQDVAVHTDGTAEQTLKR